MNKEEKRKMLKTIKEQEKLRFESSLPMEYDMFKQLFDYIDGKLSDDTCYDDLRFTLEFLQMNHIDESPVTEWLKENGGYCDCEVLANAEEKFY